MSFLTFEKIHEMIFYLEQMVALLKEFLLMFLMEFHGKLLQQFLHQLCKEFPMKFSLSFLVHSGTSYFPVFILEISEKNLEIFQKNLLGESRKKFSFELNQPRKYFPHRQFIGYFSKKWNVIPKLLA